MPTVTLKSGAEKTIQTPSRFLSVINTSGQFEVSAVEFRALAGKSGRTYTLDNITQVTFSNTSLDDIAVEYEVSNIKVEGQGSGSVSVENEVVVKRIVEAQAIDVNAQIDSGTVSLISASSLEDLLDVSVSSGQTKQIAAANAGRTSIIIQNLSADGVRVGGATTAANRGFFVPGGGVISFNTKAAVRAHNASQNDVVLAMVQL